MKEYDKRKSHNRNKFHMIYTSSNNVRHAVTNSCNTCRNAKILSTPHICIKYIINKQNVTNSRMITTYTTVPLFTIVSVQDSDISGPPIFIHCIHALWLVTINQDETKWLVSQLPHSLTMQITSSSVNTSIQLVFITFSYHTIDV